MCGIAGIYSSREPIHPRLESACRYMMAALAHRGPDAHWHYLTDRLALGHHRLSIIDTSHSADQPLSNENGTVWLACNGEIYNYRQLRDRLTQLGHRFKSHTDSEVILHLYEEQGVQCLQDLRGMFAFVLWDETCQRLLLARDRFGIKPLYYWASASTVVFASEVRAIQACGLVPVQYDSKALGEFLQYGSIPSPSTFLESVRSVPAGHYLVQDASGLVIHRYWDLRECWQQPEGSVTAPEALGEFLKEAVRQHVVSDVPCGILLSGGMDSSTLVALAQEVTGRAVDTLTIGFEERAYDESQAARLTSQQFGTRHQEHFVTPHEVSNQLAPFFRAMDQPTVDGLNTFLVTKRATEIGLRVLLSGLGGDELFGGYAHFRSAAPLFQSVSLLARVPRPVRSWILNGLRFWFGRFGSSGPDRLLYLEDPSWESAYRVTRGLFGPQTIRELVGCDLRSSREEPLLNSATVPTPLDQAILFELSRYLGDQLLRDTDVFGMCHAVEVRVPFLDHQLARAVLSIPARTRYDPRVYKLLLRQMMEGRLPRTVLASSKRGFTFPLAPWLKSSLRSEVEEILFDPGSNSLAGFQFNQEAIRSLWARFLKGKVHWSQPWALVVLKRWWRERCEVRAPQTIHSAHVVGT